jgi:internalin A
MDLSVISKIRQVKEQEHTTLNLSSSRLTRLPDEVFDLTNVEVIILDGNQLKTIPREVAHLPKLRELYARYNSITSVPPEIGKLQRLEIINFYHNKLFELPEETGDLIQLRCLYLAYNELQTLPRAIGRLTRLSVMDISSNQLEDLPRGIGKLETLSTLYLSSNKLEVLPPEIGDLTALTNLDVSRNRLIKIDDNLGRLTSLTHLNLDGNRIESLPKNMSRLTSLNVLTLQNNHLSIPLEILEQDPSEIIHFIERDSQGLPSEKMSRETKVLVLGEGGAGKTSLVNQLIYGRFYDYEKKTEGISIKHWKPKAKKNKNAFNVWDFGGQELMHATHQFFFTRRSVYIIVIDGRQDEHAWRVEYWLRLVESYAPESAVIIALNKADIARPTIDQASLCCRYPSIASFLSISCRSGAGIPAIRAAIIDCARKIVGEDVIPAKWASVKRHIEASGSDTMSVVRFRRLCEIEGVFSQRSQDILLQFLHDSGVVVNFMGSINTREITILNPIWITKAIYGIMNSYVVFSKSGILQVRDLADILGHSNYPEDTHPFILTVMENFEIAFRWNNDSYLIPDLLSKDPPVNKRSGFNSVACEYVYDFLPSSVIVRLITRAHKLFENLQPWREGFLCSLRSVNIEVVAHNYDRAIKVSAAGDPATVRDAFTIMRSQLYEINSSIPRIRATERVYTCPDLEAPIDRTYLECLDNKGINEYVAPGKFILRSVSDALHCIGLDDVASLRQRIETLQKIRKLRHEKLAFLEEQFVVIVDPSQKFQVSREIETEIRALVEIDSQIATVTERIIKNEDESVDESC